MTEQLDWSAFLARYHAQRPGATEDLLAAARNSSGIDPYSWLLADVDPNACVVDLACGSAPMRARHAGPWLGLDRSAAELARAQTSGATALGRADAQALPLRSASASVVVCSMALMLFQPTDLVLAELRRVLAPKATLHALLPTAHPLTVRDRSRYLTLYATLRMPARLPRTPFRRRPDRRLRASGFTVVCDERARFAYPLTDHAAVERFINALYLPGVSPTRVRAAYARASAWIGSDIGVALRRIVASAPR